MFRYLTGFFLAVSSFVVFADGKLIFAIDLVRHGDRTPLIVSPAMQKIFPEGVGQLTPKGMHQEYELGQYLRRSYVDINKLLPEKYDIRTISVRSSNKARTMMSAQALLFGLYPLGTGPYLSNSVPALPKALQPIPINTVPEELDSLLIPGHDKQENERLLHKYIYNSRAWMAKEQELAPRYSHWSRVFGIDVANLYDVMCLSDRLYIEKLYNIASPKDLSDQDKAMITATGKWAILYMANNHNLSIAYGRKLARTIKDEINTAATTKRALKYLLFVAHDTTIEAQLNLLQQEVTELPPYAARLNYALYDTGSAYVVKVSLNRKPLNIQACGGNTCNLDKFIKLFEDTLNTEV